MYTFTQRKFLLLLLRLGTSPHPSLEAQIPALKLRSRTWGSNPSLKAQIPALSSNPSPYAQIQVSMFKPKPNIGPWLLRGCGPSHYQISTCLRATGTADHQISNNFERVLYLNQLSYHTPIGRICKIRNKNFLILYLMVKSVYWYLSWYRVDGHLSEFQ